MFKPYKPNAEELALLKSGEWRNDYDFKMIMKTRRLDLLQAYLYRADLCGANLCKANLIKAYLRGANLYKANLREANLRETDLRNANLYNAILYKANLTDAIIDKNNFDQHIDKSIWECEVIKNDIVRIKRKGLLMRLFNKLKF